MIYAGTGAELRPLRGTEPRLCLCLVLLLFLLMTMNSEDGFLFCW